MALRDRIQTALKEAMKAKEAQRLSTLRLITAAIKDRDIAARASGDAEETGVSDADITGILARMVKQRHDSARAYEEGGRLELAEQERGEIGIIEEFLPRQMDEAEIDAAIEKAVAETGAAGIRDMGRVMGALKAAHAGRMDFGAAGPKVKARLS